MACHCMKRCMHAYLTLQLQLRKLTRLQTFNSVLGGKLLAVVLEVQHDLGSLLNATCFSYFKHSRAGEDSDGEPEFLIWVQWHWEASLQLLIFNKKDSFLLSSWSHPLLSPIWGPLVSGRIGLSRPGVDVNTVSYHEGRVEPHPELTNDGAVCLCLVLQGIQKCLQQWKTLLLWDIKNASIGLFYCVQSHRLSHWMRT